jgi:hypothetical protein
MPLEDIAMPVMPADELHAKVIIAAALIQAQTVGLNYSPADMLRSWKENEALVRLQTLTQRVYEAISEAGDISQPPPNLT